MDTFETPYDEDVEFFECKACNKCLRGKTLYKIHMTTPGHVKKEAALFSKGCDVKQFSDFRDILHYLDYLNLDEPIIGLGYLEEKPCKDPQDGPSYRCNLCYLDTNLEEMVRHVIGRKHRQKYMERNRPDLVNWGNTTMNSQGGKVIRAKAEIVERQDGRGKPVPLDKKKLNEGNFSASRVAPRQQQTGSQGIPEMAPKNVPPLIPGLMSSKSEFSHQRNCYPEMSTFQSDESNKYRDRQEETFSHDRWREEPRREDYRVRRMLRDDYISSDDHQYEGGYIEEPQRRMLQEPGNVLRYDGDKLHHGQHERAERYPEKSPTYEKPNPERDWLKEFYVEEVSRGSAHLPSQPVYSQPVEKRTMERESSQRDSMTRGRIQESGEPNTIRKNYSTPEREQSHDHLFSIIRDYQHKIREPRPEEKLDNLGSNRQGEVTRRFSDIPEPFKRFLKGPANNEEQGKRKRKSRFSDATPEEQEMTNKIFRDEYGPPPPKFGGDSRHVGAPPTTFHRPEINRRQYSHHVTQSPQHTESYQEGGTESEGIFDMLKNIEIENVEEAFFLKNKLCSLLKEFKSKKMEKAMRNSQSLASTSKGYNDPQLPRQRVLERPLGGDSDHRQPDLHFRDNSRVDPQPWEHRPDERDTDYHHLGHRELRHSNRSHYEEVFGSSQTSQVNEPRSHPERFQEHVHPCEYQPSAAQYFDSHSPALPLHMEQDSRMHRSSRYSNTLDKITSTLLELVARK